MFDLAEKRLAWIPVKWPGFASAGDDVGRPVEHEVELRVELPDLDRFATLFMDPVAEDGTKLPNRTDADFDEWKAGKVDDDRRADELVVDWRKVMNAGTPVPFTPEAMRKLLRVPNFSRSFFESYAAAYAGREKLRAGNSEGSLETGPSGEPAANG
jgi:hypothetical protein